eukprot:CAMPEP_0168545332 /NCGR_PEP_ID=MMETSP0413-20121227/2905_1 /TAXON_ID=136452 /ORGANISM="Filamoeba nolandi, Strain NC-AS-23-1" /LENGTH=175 /DNA_ID=CAMNT_0008575429 /DNA_START=29 /DNA_END=553 /DNA_ORIENTATION=+
MNPQQQMAFKMGNLPQAGGMTNTPVISALQQHQMSGGLNLPASLANINATMHHPGNISVNVANPQSNLLLKQQLASQHTSQIQPQTQLLQPPQDKKRKRGMFATELKHMMYGFGDTKNPLPESVDLLEDIVVEYITEMTQKSMQMGSKRGKLQTEDLIFLIRKDRKKYARAKELL